MLTGRADSGKNDLKTCVCLITRERSLTCAVRTCVFFTDDFFMKLEIILTIEELSTCVSKPEYRSFIFKAIFAFIKSMFL